MSSLSQYFKMAMLAYGAKYCNKPIILKVLNSTSKPIKNTKMKLIGCNKILNVSSNSEGLIYLYNIPYGIYQLRIYINNNCYFKKNIKICSPKLYVVKICEDIYSTICGRIYNKVNSKSIPSATVILFKYNNKCNNFICVGKTTTDVNGKYCFKNISYGSYFIKAIK